MNERFDTIQSVGGIRRRECVLGRDEVSPAALVLVTTPHSLCLGFVAAVLIVTKL